MDDEEFELMLMHKFAYELDPDLWAEQEEEKRKNEGKD